jgi:hypothetical protein
MSIETALAAGSVAEKVMETGSQMSAASHQKEILRIQQKEKHLQLDQQRLGLYSNIEKTLATQEAQTTVKGIALSSPTVNAIQRETLSIGSENFQNIKTQKELVDYNTEVEQRNVDDRLTAQIIGDVSSGIKSFAQLKGL